MKVSEQPRRGSPPRSGRPRATGGGDGHRRSRFSQLRFRTDSSDTASFTNPPRRARARRTVPGSGRPTEKVRRSDSASAPGPGPATSLRRGGRGRIAGGIPAVARRTWLATGRERPGPSSASALRGLSSSAWLGPGAGPEENLGGETEPMEGSNVASLATAERHHGLVSGAKPWSWLLRVLSTGSTAYQLPR
jgi:hypothetical protein